MIEGPLRWRAEQAEALEQQILRPDQLDEFIVDGRLEFARAKTGSAHGAFEASPFLALQEGNVGGDFLADPIVGAGKKHFADDAK